MIKRLMLMVSLMLGIALPSLGQQFQVSGKVMDSNGTLYANGSGRVVLVTPGNAQPTVNGSAIQTVYPISSLGSFATFSLPLYSNFAISPAGSQYNFSFCDQTQVFCFTTTLITISSNFDATAFIQPQAAILPLPGTLNLGINGHPVYNPNFINSPTVTWAVFGSNIQATAIGGGGGGGGGSTVSINSVGTTTPNFLNTTTFHFGLSGQTVTGIPVAQGNEGELQLNHSGLPAAVTGLGVDSVTSPTTLLVPLDAEIKGPNPYFDIRSYGARAVSIATTGSGSGTSLTVGSSAFINKDGIVIAGAGNAPAISAPTGLTITSSAAAGMTAPDALTVPGLAGSTTDQYILFACDILGGCTVPTASVTTTTANATLGEIQVPISTWSLLYNTLTIVTSVPNNFPQYTVVHITGTSNNSLAGGWYPVSSVTNSSTLVFNNVPQFSATTVSGTGGLITTFAGNLLTWTASAGPSGTTPPTAVWDYYVCAKRPGDGSFSIIGRSFPSTLFSGGGQGYVSTRFVDFGPVLSANPIIPWYVSNANCTAGAAQNELFLSTVASGGGTTALTLGTSMPNPVSGAAVRQDSVAGYDGALVAAVAAHGSVYIPAASSPFIFNSYANAFAVGLWQTGQITFNDTFQVISSVNWYGQTGAGFAPQFAFNGAPGINCNAWPCIYVGGFSGDSSGGNTFSNISPSSTQNGLEMMVDSAWGFILDKVNLSSGSNNNDNMGMDLVIRPGAANYKIRNSNFGGGPNQVVDQTWTPMLYADRGITGCCGSSGSVGTIDIDNVMWNRRGVYYVADGGSGISLNVHGFYRQGGITPMVTVQNIANNVGGEIELDSLQHDTESQAAYAWICNLVCSGAGYGVPTHLGFVNLISQDAGTIPQQLTGGGGEPINQIVATISPGGTPVGAFGPNMGQGWVIINGRLTPTIGINIDVGDFPGVDISPFVPTPKLSLESGSFFANIVAGSLSGNITLTTPTTSGTLCTTTTCGGGGFYQTIQVNGTPQTQEPTANYVAGSNMTITPTTVGGVTTLTFISSSTASTAFSSITAGPNSNAGTFSATGNTWNFGAASGFTLPSGTTIPGSGSGAVTLAAQAAAGTPTVTFGTSSGTPAVTASSPLAITTATGNITCATCATTTNGGALSGTAPISISVAGAISISAATTGALGSIELTGNLGGTGASPTVISTTITGFTTNHIVKFNSGGNLVNTAALEASSVFTVPELLDTTTNAQVSEVANGAVTGTTVNALASLTGAPSTAIITTAAATGGVVGIVAGGAGTTGNAQIAVSGQEACIFDGGTTAGDYVQISASVNGDCTDAGATPPSSGQVLGLVLTTNASAGTYNVFLFGPGAAAGGGGGGSGTVNACASFATHPLSYYTASTAVSCDANMTISAGALTLGIAGSTAGSLLLSGSSSGVVSLKTQAAAGTYNWNYPTTAGTATYLLTSQGGSSSAMTWTVPTVTVNGVSCTLSSTCTTLTLETIGANNGSQILLNFVASTSNTIGLTNTPVNSGTSQEQFQITGTVNASGGGTGIPNPTAHSLLMAEGGANMNLITSPSLNGNYICGFNVTTSAAVDVSCNLTGVPVLTPSSGYTGAYSDRATVQLLSGGSTFTWNAPQITGNTAANFPVLFINNNSGSLTFQTNAADRVNGGSLGGTYVTPTLWATFMYQDNSSAPGNWWPLTVAQYQAFPTSCGDTGGNHLNIVSGVFTCGTSSSTGGGTVTSIATTLPITGGTITTTGTIACATCVTSAASLTSTAIVIGGGLQASSTDSSATLVAGALSLAGGGSVTLGGSSSGTFAITVASDASSLSFGSNASISSAGVLTVVSCSGCGSAGAASLSSLTAASGSNTLANGNNGAQVWNWAQTSNSQTAFTFGETTAATGTSDIELAVKTIAGSTAIPLAVSDSLTGSQTLAALRITPTWNTTGVVDAALLINVTNTASGTASLLLDAQVGGTSQFKVDKGGNLTALGSLTGSSLSVSGAAAANQLNFAETTAPSGASSTDICYGDSTSHTIKCSFNNGSFSTAAPVYGYVAANGVGAGLANPDLIAAYNYVAVTAAIQITRIMLSVQTVPLTCATTSQFGVFVNGSQSGSVLTLPNNSGKTFDSGPITPIAVSAGSNYQIGVTRAEASCGTKAASPVLTVEYTMQ